MVNFELREAVLSEKEKKELETARTLPITYDEDSPELDETMEQAFRQARRKKPYSGKPLTVYVSPKTMEKAKSLGDDYEAGRRISGNVIMNALRIGRDGLPTDAQRVLSAKIHSQ